MADEYRDLTRRRLGVSAVRETVDAITGLLNLVGLEPVDEVIDYTTNAAMWVYSMAQSPYTPWRESNWAGWAGEGVVYTLAGLTELLPIVNDVTPAYVLASAALDQIYARR